MDNKHRKLFVIRQSEGANLCLKCTEMLGSLSAYPGLLAAMGDCFWEVGERERRG